MTVDRPKSPMKTQLPRDTTWRILVQLKLRMMTPFQANKTSQTYIKAMLVDIKISLSSILYENKQFKKELDELKASLQLSDIELRDMKTKLDEAAKANIKLKKKLHATTTSLESARRDLQQQTEEINYLNESLVISNNTLVKTA